MAGSSGLRRPDTVNETAFQAIILGLAMKIELRKHLQSQDIPNFKTEVKKDILENGGYILLVSTVMQLGGG